MNFVCNLRLHLHVDAHSYKVMGLDLVTISWNPIGSSTQTFLSHNDLYRETSEDPSASGTQGDRPDDSGSHENLSEDHFADGGSGITQYTLYYRSLGNSESSAASPLKFIKLAPQQTSISLSGLLPKVGSNAGQVLLFHVTSTNIYGESDWSPTMRVELNPSAAVQGQNPDTLDANSSGHPSSSQLASQSDSVGGVIAAISVVGLVAIVMLAASIFFCRRHRQNRGG